MSDKEKTEKFGMKLRELMAESGLSTGEVIGVLESMKFHMLYGTMVALQKRPTN